MIIAAADGSSLSNPGPAGWAWYIDQERWAAGGWPHGTNNMGELMAVIDLLQQTAELDDDLRILCDSQYVIKCATTWLPGWKRRGWRKADGKPVLNVELLKELDAALVGRRVDFAWVKGHAGHDLNEAADERARAAATAYRDGTQVNAGPGWGAEVVPGARTKQFAPTVIEPEPDLFSDAAHALGPVLSDVASSDEASSDEAASDDVASEDGPSSQLVTLLVAHERELLAGPSPARLAELLHPDYVGHDAQGRIITRGRRLASIEASTLTARIEVLGVSEYASGLVALRWRLSLGSRDQLRFSLWEQHQQGWRLRFAQATGVNA